MESFNIAIIGGTGMVGSKIIEIMEERKVPVNELMVFASKRSKGEIIQFNNKKVEIEELTEENFLRKNIDIALFAAGGDISSHYIPLAVDKGIICIDNSSVFRMDEDVPLIVPEINGDIITKNNLIISNPNCSTTQSVMAIQPIYEKYGVKRIIYNTYQAVSGSGSKGIKDLKTGIAETYPYSIQNNCLPHIDDFLENGYTKEEMKMIDESKKILQDDDLKITATTVRVPIINSHAVSINLELESNFKLEDVMGAIKYYPGLVLKDDISNKIYPLAEDANGSDKVYVGRIRRDASIDNGLNLWCVADNIRKGAATNTVQILELMIKKLKEE